jgi:transposase
MDQGRPKKSQNLHRPSGKKSGVQSGHKENTLKMTARTDNIVEPRPEYCNDCGSSLGNVPPVLDKKRQTVDIPPIRAVCTEYRTHAR